MFDVFRSRGSSRIGAPLDRGSLLMRPLGGVSKKVPHCRTQGFEWRKTGLYGDLLLVQQNT